MNTTFKSDFSLIPVSKEGNPGWEYRLATWPPKIDPLVHDLFDKKETTEITYDRRKIRDGTLQKCEIVERNGRIIMKPGDGFNYYIKKISNNNKLTDCEDEINDDEIPHNMKCEICLVHKKTHAIVPCFHVVACSTCATKLFKNDVKTCPICGNQFIEPLKKLFF